MSNNGNNTNTTQRWAVVEKDYWNGVAVGWRDIPPHIFDTIPPWFIYTIPHLMPSGELVERSVVYLGEVINEEDFEDMVETYGNVHGFVLPDLNVEIIVPENDLF